ncbi:hypothetical protein BJY04DRAFT_210899 [Aspergillus karnatakaensis]|uniref:uncharacterized protein n=1 Tax=Aspergillus karnatakaensis TaxID=1810916 RepID=UPI003CCC91BC
MSQSTLSTAKSTLSTLYGPLPPSSPQTWTTPPSSGGHKGRYLWTDAFGVLTLITLHRELNSPSSPSQDRDQDNTYLALASALITTVHDILGSTRDGKSRLPRSSERKPLSGGLRIGKIDADGPDGDGQYHHYLTLWMFALNRMSLATNESRYNEMAVELAKGIHPRFVFNREIENKGGDDHIRMVWKMDTGLEKVLVGSQGNLDPVDGFVVFRLLQGTAAYFNPGGSQRGVLQDEIEDYARIMKRRGAHSVSADPLDLGMTMWTVQWCLGEDWASGLAERCFERVYDLFEVKEYLSRSTSHRLAFREFGTALGIRCLAEQGSEKDKAVDLKVYADRILESWKGNMQDSIEDGTPEDLKPITRVMYAAALIPGAFRRGYLGREPKI